MAASEPLPFADAASVGRALSALPVADAAAMAAARARQASLTKPAGALGRLEETGIFLSGWQGTATPRIERVRITVFAGNHGVAAAGVSAYPPAVTVAMVENFRNGGAAINALAGVAGAELRIVALDLAHPTADFRQAPAMRPAECLAAMAAGAAEVHPDLDLFVPGEMGIGNTTPAAAIATRVFGGEAGLWVGPGSGLDAAGVARKVAVVAEALARHATTGTAFELLCTLGGREIAAMAGAILRARQLRVPVLLDGFICGAALAALFMEAPAIVAHCLAGHLSAEPGHRRLLEALGLAPLLSLGLRLGEGSGAALAVPLLRAAARTQSGMATFAEAGVPTA